MWRTNPPPVGQWLTPPLRPESCCHLIIISLSVRQPPKRTPCNILTCMWCTTDTCNCFYCIHSIRNVAEVFIAVEGHCATSRKVAGSIPDGVIEVFRWHNPSGPGVDSPSSRNDYQEYLLGSKGGRRVSLTTVKSGSLSIPVQGSPFLFCCFSLTASLVWRYAMSTGEF